MLIDERMMRCNKVRHSFSQYIRDKQAKWGMNLYVLADAETGYTYGFDVYVGYQADKGPFGSAYRVVMNLVKSLFNLGSGCSLTLLILGFSFRGTCERKAPGLVVQF